MLEIATSKRNYLLHLLVPHQLRTLLLRRSVHRLVRLHDWQPHFVGSLPELEHRYILQTLARAGNNRTQTAKLLGISLRCLQYKLNAYRQGSLDRLTPFDGQRRHGRLESV
jgi:hypothetical protein